MATSPASPRIVVSHTIVAENGGAGSTLDANGTFAAGSVYNLVGNGDGAGVTNGVNGNLVGSTGALLDPRLDLLADNGGKTRSHALLPGSPAFNAGDPSFTPPPAFDQRGEGYARVLDGRIDIGAYEGGWRCHLPLVLRSY